MKSSEIEVPDFKEKSAEEIAEFSAKELASYQKERYAYELAVQKKESYEQIEKIQKDNETLTEELKDQIADMQKEVKRKEKEFDIWETKLKAVEENSSFSVKKEDENTIQGQIKKNKEQITALKNKDLGSVKLEIAEKASHAPTDITDRNELGQFIPGVGEIPYQGEYMRADFRTQNANTEYIKYVDQASVVRDAKNVAACAASTHNSKVTFEVLDLQMKKVRDYTDVCIDMMEDYDFVEGEIRKLVNVDVGLKVDNDLLLGDGAGANINGVDSYASTFAANASGADYSGAIANAQLIDLLVVAGAQIKAFGSQKFWMPNVVQLNPKDATLLGMLKDLDENYIKAGTVNANIFRDQNGTLYINGMKVIENPNVPENEAYIYDSRQGTIYQRRNKVVELSYENATNFETETVTVKAYERLNLLVKNTQANAFMHISDISAGVTAITAT